MKPKDKYGGNDSLRFLIIHLEVYQDIAGAIEW